MSDLQRSFAKAKLASLPFNPPPPPHHHHHRPLDYSLGSEDRGYFDEAEEEEEEGEEQREEGLDSLRPLPSPSAAGLSEDDSSSASSASSTGTVVPSPGQKLFARGRGPPGPTSRLAPLPWTDFFSQSLRVTPDHPASITHHVYLTPPSSKTAPLFIMHHGAGSSGLSFAAVAQEIRKLAPEVGILALDARGHGSTAVGNPSRASRNGTLDLSLDALCGDLERAFHAVKKTMAWADDLGVVLVGHSLGGAVVATLAKDRRLQARILGFAVLDVVEGSAMDALQSMQAYLSTRPKSFSSIEQGVDWHLRSRTIRTSLSARVSVPALLRPEPPPAFNSASGSTGAERPDPSPSSHPTRFLWKTDLAATQPFWENWYAGLSSKFLTARGGKLLVLAGTDRLDKELMIGQMQGKFALQIFPEAGHFVHEDAPEKAAMVLVDFWRRNDGGRLVLPMKVGEMLAREKQV